MQILVAALIAVLVFLQYLLLDRRRRRPANPCPLQIAVQAQQEDNAALAERNSALAAEVEDLKRGFDGHRGTGTLDMGMIRKGTNVLSPARTAAGSDPTPSTPAADKPSAGRRR